MPNGTDVAGQGDPPAETAEQGLTDVGDYEDMDLRTTPGHPDGYCGKPDCPYC